MVIEDKINEAVDRKLTESKEGDNIKIDKPIAVNKDVLNANCVGLDVGTMNLVSALLNDKDIKTKRLRNVFLEIDADDVGNMDLSYMSYVKIDNKLYFLSEDAYNFANIFGKDVMRPMKQGLISSSELDSIDILSVMLKELIGNGQKDSICCYSVPANPIDDVKNIIYHENIFGRIISQLGYNPVPLNEAVAVIYAECSNSNFTGIGISFGAGMTNVSVVFRSVPVLTFSLARGGDWIDSNVANSIGIVSNRITRIKERDDFDLLNFSAGKKQDRRIKEALVYYYKNLINYTTKQISLQLNKISTEFPSEIPIIVSGGTSMAKGFTDFVIDIFNDYEFPFDISEIRSAANPLTAVAEGCLTKALKL